MPRTNQHGKSIRRVLQWLTNRDLTDADMAAALDIPAANYGRRRVHDDFPTFEELTSLGEHFGVSPYVLPIAFGFLPRVALLLLDERGRDQYAEQGGGTVELQRNGEGPGAGSTKENGRQNRS